MCFDIWCQWNWAGGLIPLKIRRGKKGVMYLCIRIAQNGLKSRYVIGVERHVVRIKKGESSNEPWLSITAASFKAHDLIGVQWHIIKNHLAFKSLLEKKKKKHNKQICIQLRFGEHFHISNPRGSRIRLIGLQLVRCTNKLPLAFSYVIQNNQWCNLMNTTSMISEITMNWMCSISLVVKPKHTSLVAGSFCSYSRE